MGSISRHITPLVINSLGGGHTHTRKHTHMHIDSRTKAILRNQARAWFKNEFIKALTLKKDIVLVSVGDSTRDGNYCKY